MKKILSKLKYKLKNNAQAFRKDERGAIAVITVITFPVLAFAVGLSFDYWRASAAQTALQQAVDSTTQTITAKINKCLDKTNRVTTVNGDKLDTGCFDYVASGDADLDLGQSLGIKASDVTDNPDIMVQDVSKYKEKGSYLDSDATFKNYVLAKIRDSYYQVSYDKTRPTTEYGVGHSNKVGVSYIDGKGIGIPYLSSVTYDKKTGQLDVSAYVYYDCFVAQILIPKCRLRGDTINENQDAFAQADRLLIDDPGTHEIWAEENDSPDLPVQLTATGGWTPYTYGYKTSLPSGLTMTSSSGVIDGTPADVACSVTSCTPQNLTASTVYVQDAGDQNRDGANKQTAYTSVGWLLVHKLKISVDDQTLYVGDSFTSPAPTRTGGKSPFAFSWTARTDTSGAMSQTPPGMTLNTSNGKISGTPTTPSGTPGSNGLPAFTFYEKVTDGRNKYRQQTVRYTVLPKPITITKDGDLSSTGPVYVETYVRYSGGYGTLTVNCAGLPSGLKCTDKTQTSIKISGTANQPGTGFIDVNVSDEWAQSVQQKVYYNFVAPPVTVTVDDYLKSSDAGIVSTASSNSLSVNYSDINSSNAASNCASATSKSDCSTAISYSLPNGNTVNSVNGYSSYTINYAVGTYTDYSNNTVFLKKSTTSEAKSVSTKFHASGGWGDLVLTCINPITSAYLNSIQISCTDNKDKTGNVSGTVQPLSISGTNLSTYLYYSGNGQDRLANINGSLFNSSPQFQAKACDAYSNCATADIYYDFSLYNVKTTAIGSGGTSTETDSHSNTTNGMGADGHDGQNGSYSGGTGTENNGGAGGGSGGSGSGSGI